MIEYAEMIRAKAADSAARARELGIAADATGSQTEELRLRVRVAKHERAQRSGLEHLRDAMALIGQVPEHMA